MNAYEFLVPVGAAWVAVAFSLLVFVYAVWRAGGLQRDLSSQWDHSLIARAGLCDASTTVEDQPEPVLLLAAEVYRMRSLPSPDFRYATEMAFAGYYARLAGLRALPNLCMLGGLIGTVVGLSMAVGAIGPAVMEAAKTSDVTSLSATIASQLGQFRTAFSSTFWGLLLAVFTHIRVLSAAGRLAASVSAASRVVMDQVVPAVMPPGLEASLQKVQQEFAAIGEATRRTAADMAAAAAPLAEQVSKLIGATETSTQQFNQSSSGLMASATSMQQNIAQLGTLQQEIREQMHAVQQTFREELDKVIKAQGTALTRFTNKADAVAQRLEETQSTLSGGSSLILVRLGEIAGKLEGSIDQFSHAADRFDEMSRDIGHRAYEGMFERADQFVEVIRETQGAVVNVNRDLSHIMDEVANLMNRLNPQSLPSDEWNRLCAALGAVISQHEVFQQEQERLHTSLERQAASFDAAASAMEGMRADLSKEIGTVAKATAKAEALADATKEARETAKQLAARPAELAQAVKGAADTIRQAAEAFGKALNATSGEVARRGGGGASGGGTGSASRSEPPQPRTQAPRPTGHSGTGGQLRPQQPEGAGTRPDAGRDANEPPGPLVTPPAARETRPNPTPQQPLVGQPSAPTPVQEPVGLLERMRRRFGGSSRGR